MEKTKILNKSLDSQIKEMVLPGIQVNQWRRDYEKFLNKRLWAEHYQKQKIEILHRFTPNLNSKRILDLGCGKGGLTAALSLKNCNITAFDLRFKNCKVTKLRGLRYNLTLKAITGEAEFLPFADQSFAVIACLEVLEHVQSPKRVMEEVYRVLQPGGICFVTITNKYCFKDPHYKLWFLSFLPYRLAKVYLKIRGRWKNSYRDRQEVSDMHYYKFITFEKIVREIGFSLIDIREDNISKQSEKYSYKKYLNAIPLLRIGWYRFLRKLSLGFVGYRLILKKG
jgi:2-polyprenyl-3-methyl-5-hydroxy-6-metoxy-1,4-benzoquinol methylase